MSVRLMTPRLALGLLTLLAIGCNRADEHSETLTPSARKPLKSLHDPLTDDEVHLFLAVLEDLPEHRAPEFQPLSQVTANEQLTGEQLAELFRQEYRAMFDASRHGDRWRKDARVMTALQKHALAPEDLASLMMRLSCAIAASAVSSRDDLTRAAAKADEQLVHLIQQINQLDAGGRYPASIEQRRDALEALQDLVAFSEFTRLLEQVPAESCATVSRFRGELARHLPTGGHVETFERTIESQVVPTSFEQSPAAR